MMLDAIGTEAMEALAKLVAATTTADYDAAMRRLHETLGPRLPSYRPLLESIDQRLEELDQLRALAGSDWLTGLANRRTFNEAVNREIARCRRSGNGFAVLLLDLDDLKARNDSFGHAAGDAALVKLAHACSEIVRETDLVARLGGDEFGVLLAGATLAGARAFAERLRDKIQSCGDEFGALRVSIGVAMAEQASPNIEQLLADADSDLYRDKAMRKRSARTRAA